MRILHILGELKPSGAEVMLSVSAEYWRSGGADSSIMSTGAASGVYTGQLIDAGYRVLHFPFDRTIGGFLRLYKFLKTEKFDVVFVHAERASFWYLLTVFVSGAKAVRVVHAIFCFRGWLRVIRAIQRRVMHLVGVRYVAISDSVRACESGRYGVQCELIYNWIDTNKFRPPTLSEQKAARISLNLIETKVVITSVGNCSQIKNHTELIRALATLSDRDDWLYLHVGLEEPGEPERHLARQLGIEDRIIFAGWLSDPRIALWASDIFVMPSRHEGLGNSAIEALATGLPVLLTDVPGLRDFRTIVPSVIYSDCSAGSIAVQIRRILSKGALLSESELQAQVGSVANNFSIQKGVGLYLKLVKELLGQRLQSKPGGLK